MLGGKERCATAGVVIFYVNSIIRGQTSGNNTVRIKNACNCYPIRGRCVSGCEVLVAFNKDDMERAFSLC